MAQDNDPEQSCKSITCRYARLMNSYRKHLLYEVIAAKGVSATESLGVLSFSQEFIESFEYVSFL